MNMSLCNVIQCNMSVLSVLTHFYIMQAPHINSYQNRAVNFGIQPNRVRLAPNGTNLGLLKISSSIFWLAKVRKVPDLAHLWSIWPNLNARFDVSDHKLCTSFGLAIFRMKKNQNLPATCHTGIRLNLHNFGMDLFLIIFVNFKTPCLHGNSS